MKNKNGKTTKKMKELFWENNKQLHMQIYYKCKQFCGMW